MLSVFTSSNKSKIVPNFSTTSKGGFMSRFFFFSNPGCVDLEMFKIILAVDCPRSSLEVLLLNCLAGI